MIERKGLFKKSGDTLWLHSEGRTYTVSLRPERSGARKTRTAQEEAPGLLVSPMPGKIQKIPVKANDRVRAGATVCVIEAMKMEYPLKAPFDGIVKKVMKKEMDLVQLDEPVIVIEKI